MVDTVFPFQVVLFTQLYSISGGLFLREQTAFGLLERPARHNLPDA